MIASGVASLHFYRTGTITERHEDTPSETDFHPRRIGLRVLKPVESPRTPSLTWNAGTICLAAVACFLLYFYWSDKQLVHLTPYDGQTLYALRVTVDGKPLTTEDINQRYHLTSKDRTALTPLGLKQVVRHYESHYANKESAYIRLHYSKTGGDEVIWLWPEE